MPNKRRKKQNEENSVQWKTRRQGQETKRKHDK